MLDVPGISPVVLALDIVEEDVTKSPRSVYCNQCRVAGESAHHPPESAMTSHIIEKNKPQADPDFTAWIVNEN